MVKNKKKFPFNSIIVFLILPLCLQKKTRSLDFSDVSSGISQGLSIIETIKDLTKKEPDPDNALTVREKYYKDKNTLERFCEKYSKISEIKNLKIDDFKYDYDEVEKIFKSNNISRANLVSGWQGSEWYNNEVSYIIQKAQETKDKIERNINKIENKNTLDDFKTKIEQTKIQYTINQNEILQMIEKVNELEQEIKGLTNEEKSLFRLTLKKSKITNEEEMYNIYNAILDSIGILNIKKNFFSQEIEKFQELKNKSINLEQSTATRTKNNIEIIKNNNKKESINYNPKLLTKIPQQKSGKPGPGNRKSQELKNFEKMNKYIVWKK